jgi:hypothetical protein
MRVWSSAAGGLAEKKKKVGDGICRVSLGLVSYIFSYIFEAPARGQARIGLVLALEFGQLLMLKFKDWKSNGYLKFSRP